MKNLFRRDECNETFIHRWVRWNIWTPFCKMLWKNQRIATFILKVAYRDFENELYNKLFYMNGWSKYRWFFPKFWFMKFCIAIHSTINT